MHMRCGQRVVIALLAGLCCLLLFCSLCLLLLPGTFNLSHAAHTPCQVAALEAEQQALYAENQTLNKQQAALSGEVRGLKQGANALTDEASQLRYKLSQAKGQTELLKSQIVQSPQKIQALLGELSAAVERERAMVADAGEDVLGGWQVLGGQLAGMGVAGPACLLASWHLPLAPPACGCVPPVAVNSFHALDRRCHADRRSRDLAARLDVVGKVR